MTPVDVVAAAYLAPVWLGPALIAGGVAGLIWAVRL